MSAIRDWFGASFEANVHAAKCSYFCDQNLETADREELLAVIGFLGEDLQRVRDNRNRDMAFLKSLDRVRG